MAARMPPPPVLLKALLVAAALTPVGAWADGKEVYMLRCASCHGSQGQGTKHMVPALAPALKGNPFVAQGSEAAIASVIRKGRSGQARLYNDTFPNMPSFGVEVVPDVPALVSFLKGDLQK